LAEKGAAFVGVVPELMTKDPKGTRRIAEAPGPIRRELLIDEESAERLILALEGRLGREEEVLIRHCYLIARTVRYVLMMLEKHLKIKMFWKAGS
jgi:hypothetical protein